MKSSTKKSRKRNLSPESNSLSEETPKRIRANQDPDSPDDQLVITRPSTRSSKTPLVSPSQTSSTRKSNASKSITKRTAGSSRTNATAGEDDEEETVPSPVGVVVASTSTIRPRKSVSRSTTKKVSQARRDPTPPILLPPLSVAATENEDFSAEATEGEESLVPVPEEVIVSSPEQFDNTMELSIIRLSRMLVVFTILLVAFVSLVRLDHDKHDTHGSISRSGRKMYSFLTLGIVKPWEWGVPREDIALLLQAEALALRRHQSQEEYAGAAVLDLIDEVDRAAKQLRMSLSSTHPPVDTTTASRVGASVADIRAHHADTVAPSYQQLRLALTAAQEQKNATAFDDDVVLTSSNRLDSQINNIHDKIATVRKIICTTDSCKLWSDFHATLGRVRENMDASIFNQADLASHKSSILNKLMKIVNTNLSFDVNINTTRNLIENSARQLDPKCLATSEENAVDIIETCSLQNILVHGLGGVLDSIILDQSSKGSNPRAEEGKDEGGEDEDEEREKVRNDSVETSKLVEGSLEGKIHTLLHSEEFKSLITGAAEDSLQEVEVHDLCIAIVKKLLKVEMNHNKQDFMARIVGSHDYHHDHHHYHHHHHSSATTTITAEEKQFVDFALAPRGGRVMVAEKKKSSYPLIAPPYIPSQLTGLLGGYRDASILISSALPTLGDCYAFEGRSGNVTVLLSAPTVIQQIGLYQMNEGMVVASAVRSFRVFGWSDKDEEDIIDMGNFSMDDHFQDQSQDQDHSGGSFRVFPLIPHSVQAVTIQFEDNFGSEEFTCVYRLQLLGSPKKQEDQTKI